MGWLRRDKDCIALVAAWALLLQSAILSFGFGLHAAAFSPGETIVLCSARGAVVDHQRPVERHQAHDWACCATSCRLACSAAAGGVLADAARVPLPGSAAILAEAPLAEAGSSNAADVLSAQPRAPPLA
jgi:hypothetical protein